MASPRFPAREARGSAGMPGVAERLPRLLEQTGLPGLAELRVVLQEILGPEALWHAVALERLKKRVFRLRVEAGGQAQSYVVKQMDAATARRNELVMRRWLPAMGLRDACPGLLGVAAELHGRCVWHVYEDLGDWRLDGADPDRRRVGAAVELIARLHVRSAGHPLLAECRREGGDLGAHYFISNVGDAVRGLEALRPPAVELSGDHRDLRDRLLARLHALLDAAPQRARALEEFGGPETLVHGDLWTTNAFVPTATGALEARLIDWDRAAVGPFSYDLSTFLYRFPSHERSWILDRYELAVRPAGWRLPASRELNVLFDTAERARYANCVIWATLDTREAGERGFEELAEVDRWFEALEPVLPG